MRALVIRGVWEDCEISMSNGYDLIIKITPRFGAVVYPANRGAQSIVDRLGWERAEFAPRVSFSFFPVTEPEIIALLRDAFDNLEVLGTMAYQPG